MGDTHKKAYVCMLRQLDHIAITGTIIIEPWRAPARSAACPLLEIHQ